MLCGTISNTYIFANLSFATIFSGLCPPKLAATASEGGGGEIRTHGGLPHAGFRNQCFRPLSHSSNELWPTTFTFAVAQARSLAPPRLFYRLIKHDSGCHTNAKKANQFAFFHRMTPPGIEPGFTP